MQINAFSVSDTQVCQLLVVHGSKVNEIDNDGRIPLIQAAQEGHLGIVQLLVERNSHIDHKAHDEDYGATPVGVNKSRSSSSTSSNETKPLNTTAPPSSVIVIGGHALHSSPSESPESTYDRRKSYHSNNSKSSSNLTSSTNQSAHSSHVKTEAPSDQCLTFTQQLQQCSMGKNRTRPVSRVLSPVSEPQSPDQTPPVSPNIQGQQKYSPGVDNNINIMAPAPIKSGSLKQEKISATINIITNPNAEMMSSVEEPVWQINPALFPQNVKRSTRNQRANNQDTPTKLMMGQSALEMRSPELRRKRNGIVTNPKVIKSPSGSQFNKLKDESENPVIHSNGFSNLDPSPTRGGTSKGPARPNGLPIKKETPL
ncbi:hypothetical protein LOTGIDRAFT_165077 [Lottia gigantea]|uniref:Uncharacterized protein n=1 Tax=Lottia gigantea TaxID=225164 RepID=V4A3H1_LOTGI|nr:hypothetical protein LOTGIDRAFT_165077 [Lottia gigantea]ESO89485.1 hypothetical protein LOTGIDRAFT_165077 [Lottia gigantea]